MLGLQKKKMNQALDELEQKTTEQLVEERYRRLLSFGEFQE